MAFLSDSKKAQKDIERRKCFRIVSGNNKEQMTDAKLQDTRTVKSVDVKLYDNGKEIQVPAELHELFEEIGSEDTIETLSKGATLTFSKGKVTSYYTRGSEKSERDQRLRHRWQLPVHHGWRGHQP